MKKHLLFSRVNPDGRTTVERRSNDGHSQGRYSVGLTKLLFTITLLLTLGVGQMWAGKGFFSDGQWNVQYWDGSSDQWIGEGGSGATKNLGVKTTLYLKKSWVKTWSDGGWTQSEVVWNYGLTDSYGKSKTATKSSVQGNQTWDFSVDYDLISNAPNNPGQNTLYMYWRLDNYVSTSASYINFTIPGFTTTSKSHTFANTTVSSTKDETISFGQHYGTALTTSNCALSGTNSTEFEVRSISETGVTVRFKPSSNGNKSATLTITDAHSKTCTITLSGKTRRVVTYKHGDYTTGDDITAYKVYETTLTLKNSGFTRTGYNLSAWNTSSNGTSGTNYDLGATYSTESALTLYPTWTAKNYTSSDNIKHANGNTAGQYNVNYDATSISYTTTPSKTGYHIEGLYYESGLSNKIVNSDRSLRASTSYTTSGSKWNQTSAPNMYVKWEANTYNITLHDNNGGSNNGSATATYDGGLSSLSAPTRSGYHVVGYYKEAELTNLIADDEGNLEASTSYTDGSGNWTYDGDRTLYAKWESDATYYTLTYGAGSSPYNNGSVSAVNASTSAAISSGASLISGTEVTFTATPTNSHYKLKGWYSDAACASAIAGAGTTNPYTRAINATQSVYAGFEIKTCAITLDRNGGNSGSTAVTATHGSTLPSFTAHGLSGYTLQGYYTETSGGTKIINADGSLVASTSYADSNKKWNSDATSLTLHAQWSENMSTVSVAASPVGAGTFSSNSVSAGVDTRPTVTATAQPGYKFTSWGITGGADMSGSTDNPVTITGKGAGEAATLTATFSRLYAYIEGRFHVTNAARDGSWTNTFSSGNWDESSTRIPFSYDESNHRFYLRTYATPKELTTQISSYNPYFYVKTSTSNSSLVNTVSYMCTSSQTLTAAGSANGKTVSSSSGSNNNLRFNNSSTTTSYAVIYFDESKIWYELEQRLQYNGNGSTGGSAPTGDNGHNSYHAKDANATAAANTFTARTNYSFVGWNTAADITGNNYAVGANVPMSADRTLYAKWNRSVTLDQQDATTPGSTSVTATWNCATLPAITNPEKEGYEFGGWYTETAGNGNIIINTSGQLQASKTNWTVDGGKFQRTPSSDASESKPLYAKWTQTVTLNANTDHHGSGSNTSATIVYKATAKTSITHCTPATGYQVEGYYSAATGGVKILNADGSFADTDVAVSTDNYIVDGAWVHAGNTTLYAHYTAKTYDVILDVNGATSGSNQTVTATFDAAMPTVCSDGTTPLAAPSKTGYTFGGYWTNTTGTGTQYYTNELASNHIWDVATNNTNIYAKWTANPYTVTLDVEEDNHGTIASADVSASVTYDAAPSTIANRPTAANGYALDGYYTDQLGEGTKVINGDGTWIASVTGYTDGSKNWIHAGDVTLYAYYKKAEITNLVAAPGVIAPGETITITPTIEPTPTGTTKVCWEVQYSNGTPLPSQPTFTPGAGNAVSFPVPTASATYIIQAKLAKGSTCPADPEDVLSTRPTTFQVAGEHTVTIRYQDSDGRTLQASASIEARPLDWTTAGDITPPTITGYTFARWDAGDGVSIKNGASETTTTTTSSIQIKAVYDGTLTAVYNKRNLIYFNNTLGWEHVYVYFYSTSDYWTSGSGSSTGTGANKDWNYGGKTPYYREFHGEMTRIEGTNIYYWDFMAGAREINPSYGYEIDNADNVAFTKDNQHGYSYFYNTEAVRRGDFNHSLSMFVPLADQTPDMHNGTKYYSSGYWMNYPENTGYDLLIYNQKTKDGATKLYEIPFEYTEDYTMPMELVVDLEAGQTYGFEIKRADGKYYSTTTTITANTSNWGLYKDQTSYCGLQTTAAGDYTFSLFYDGEYRVGVTYPVAVNDWRIVYTDLATWSKGAHTASWNHPSGVITKNSSATEVKKDTVSFFWSYGSSPAIKYQKCTATGTGSVTWNAGTAISVSDFSSVLTKSGVYNFIFEQPAGGASISLVGVEPYTGNYYIRTDCAGSTKWANFQSLDHQMTYSDYAAAKSAAAGNTGFTHYYAHWATTGQNVKFVIANDYSQCITDTLIEDIGTVVANITAEGNANAGRLNSGNASIRFMWNIITNKLSRAYIAGSSVITDRFLVLEGDARMYDENGNALTGENRDHNKEGNVFLDQDNQVVLHDDENFVYERTIQVNTTARAKLTAKYNSNIQYFKGSEGDFAEGTTVELLGGSASGKHKMRIVYDFKTNRLVTAYLPSTTIEVPLAINADLMLVREHQNAGEQITFTGSGALSDVHTVYGVMRFNRWTLNNKETTGGHSPVGDPKSAYERGLYWISFPFDVNLSDVFGFGTYGTHWIIMEYDGAERASKGYWKDSPTFWRYVTNRTNKVLEAGKGYVLALDLDLMRDNDATFWSNNIEQVELFFPSATNVGGIETTTAHTTVDEHECTIDRTNNNGADINKNRTKADSHWNIIGIPSYANYGSTLTSDGETVVNWNSSPYTNDLPFLYEWNTVDNTYTVQSGTTYPFKSMHAYMVQYHGDLYWSLASATPTPSPIVARRAYAEKPQNAEFRLELQQNEKMVDQTFVNMKDAEEISAGFKFDEDLCKEFNAGKANIYTLIENYLPAAGNTLPMSEQTTVIPVGVKIAADGDYTFAVPDGTNGVGVTLIDTETGVRMSLSALDYTINLSAGTYDSRFVLEISPVQNTATGIEQSQMTNDQSQIKKVMIDQIMYIIKDGVMYDARGARVQ